MTRKCSLLAERHLSCAWKLLAMALMPTYINLCRCIFVDDVSVLQWPIRGTTSEIRPRMGWADTIRMVMYISVNSSDARCCFCGVFRCELWSVKARFDTVALSVSTILGWWYWKVFEEHSIERERCLNPRVGCLGFASCCYMGVDCILRLMIFCDLQMRHFASPLFSCSLFF